jgi:mannose-6-phosphate isomerase-like protein (cupin superfamily)
MQPMRIDTDAVRTEWAQAGFSCELWIDPPDQIWHDFVHDVDERRLLLEGEGQVDMDGRSIRLRPGDELVIRAGTRHTVRNCGEGPARWLRGHAVPSPSANGHQHA